jgi:hypothetical protein
MMLPRLTSLLTLFVLLIVLCFSSSTFPQADRGKAVYLSYAEAQPVLAQLEDILPAAFKGKSAAEVSLLWPNWIRSRDSEIRARLALGDEDSLVNLLLFGTTYTRQPRITPEEIAKIAQPENRQSLDLQTESSHLAQVLQARSDDLIRGIDAPGVNERLLFGRRILVVEKGYDSRSAKGRARLKEYLLASVSRVLNEQASYAKVLASARLLGDPSEEFAKRSTLYRDRGLSSDTSLLPNFAVDQSLKAMQARGLILPGKIRRVAVVGPGLDFTDKQDGYDFYPQQTIQPFALVDSLLRFGLARPNDLQIDTFDLSPRVNDHLQQAKRRARRGSSYVVQLPRDPALPWKPDLVKYWEHFGDQIGKSVAPAQTPASIGGVTVRAVSIRPNFVARINVNDLNVVLQRPVLAPAERFDLIVATNIFIYYDVFEQSLAMLNVERMLRPGGILLSNNGLIELPSSRIRSIDYLTVVYSDRTDDGDHMIWYQRQPD